jgi:hypothetical protein
MDDQFEIVISRLAKLVECDPAIVQIYYDQHKISESLDTQDSSRLVGDADKYSLAYDKVRSARAAISNMSTFEKTVLAIEEFDLKERLKGIEAYLSKKDEARRAMKAEFSIQGGKNFKANAVANMVLDLFVRLNRENNLTKTSATKHTLLEILQAHLLLAVSMKHSKSLIQMAAKRA